MLIYTFALSIVYYSRRHSFRLIWDRTQRSAWNICTRIIEDPVKNGGIAIAQIDIVSIGLQNTHHKTLQVGDLIFHIKKVIMALAAQSNALAIGGSLVLPGLLIPALQKEDDPNLRIGLDEGSLFGELKCCEIKEKYLFA